MTVPTLQMRKLRFVRLRSLLVLLLNCKAKSQTSFSDSVWGSFYSPPLLHFLSFLPSHFLKSIYDVPNAVPGFGI